MLLFYHLLSRHCPACTVAILSSVVERDEEYTIFALKELMAYSEMQGKEFGDFSQ